MKSNLHQMLSIKDVAAQLQVSVVSVRRWIERGHLPHHRFGRQIRVHPADFEAFCASRRRGRSFVNTSDQ